MTEQYEFQKEKIDICVDLFFVFHKFQGDSRFIHKIPGYFQCSRRQNKFQAIQGFQGAVGILLYVLGDSENGGLVNRDR